MHNIVLICTCILGVIVPNQGNEKLPDFIPTCKAKDPQFSQCLKQAIEDLRSNLVKGIPELDIPSIDPFRVPGYQLTRQNSFVAIYNATVKQTVVTGAKDFEILDFSLNIKDLRLKFSTRLPNVSSFCKLNVDGDLFDIKLHGSGGSTLNFTNLILDVDVSGRRLTRDGKIYAEWKENNIDVKYDNVKVDLEDFLENPVQLKTLADTINYNAELLASHFIPLLKFSFGTFLLDSLNRVHSKYPLDVLYPAE